MDLAEHYDQFLDRQEALPDATQKPKFVIDDASKADWAIRKILKLQQKNNEIDQFAKQRIEETEQWQAQSKLENSNSIEYFLNLLRPYAKSQLDGGKKTIKLPSGNVSFRAVDAKFYISGEEVKGKNQKLTAFVKTNAPEYLKVEEYTDWAAFKESLTVTKDGKAISSDGEVLEFLQAMEYPDSISVKERK